jgi:hypothetical protein
MKRIFTIITVVLATFILSPRASAEGAYFGIRGEVLVPVNASLSFPVPFLGIQGGYDFGPVDQPGFGVRASLSSVLIANRISLEALYRIPNDVAGSGVYFGAGADVVLLDSSSVGQLYGAHLVAGYNFAISSSVATFVELWPGGIFNFGSPLSSSLLYFGLAGGVNFRF